MPSAGFKAAVPATGTGRIEITKIAFCFLSVSDCLMHKKNAIHSQIV